MLFWVLFGWTVVAAAPAAGSEMPDMEQPITQAPPMTQADWLDEGVALRRIGAFGEADSALQQAAQLSQGLSKQVQELTGADAPSAPIWTGSPCKGAVPGA